MSEGDRFIGMTVAEIIGAKAQPSASHYSFGSRHLPGLSKLIEENGEVGQVAGKIMGLGHMGDHWDGTNLKARLEDELADLQAAIEVFTRLNNLNRVRMYARACVKRDLFLSWHSEGPALSPDTGPAGGSVE